MYNELIMLHERISDASGPVSSPETSRHHTIKDLVLIQDSITTNLNSLVNGRTSCDIELANGIRISKNGEGNYWVKKPGIFISIGPFEDDYFGIKSKISVSLEYSDGEAIKRDTFCFNERGEGGKSKRNGHPEEPDPLTQTDIDRLHGELSAVNGSLH
jgi:hypothetical protein